MEEKNIFKEIYSKIKIYRSEFYILSVFLILIIPGIIKFIWFSAQYKQLLLSNYEKQTANIHQTIVTFFQLENELEKLANYNFGKQIDIINISIFQNDSLYYVLNKDSKIYDKTQLDSLWHKGLNLKSLKYVRKTQWIENKTGWSVYTVFNTSELKQQINTIVQQTWIKSGFIFLAFLIVFIFIVLSLINPIKKLSNELRLLLDDTNPVNLSTNYALVELNQIAESINELYEKKEVKEKKIIDEVEALIDYLSSKSEELEHAKINAETANKYKSEFLANISHEIRTPLNAILGFADHLFKIETDDSKKYYLNVIKNSGKTLIALVNDILDISKIESGKFEINLAPTNFPLLLQETSDLYSTKAFSKGLIFLNNYDPKIPQYLMLDDLRMRQILINLISNAIKFTDKGSIEITTKLLSFKPKEGKINFLLTVKDTGIGINEKYLSKIFEPFTQQEGQSFRKYGGTGLGLAIVKRLVELMNGKIVVESIEGTGTEFKLYFYDIEIVYKNLYQNLTETIYLEFNLAKILIYNNDASESELLQKILQQNKLIVYNANNFDDYIKYCENEKIDLIIYCCLDSLLVNSSDIKKFIQIAKNKNIPIIAIINNDADNNESVGEAQNHFSAILTKPIQKSLLINSIAKILNESNIKDGKTHNPNVSQTLLQDFLNTADQSTISFLRNNFSAKAKELTETMIFSQLQKFSDDLFDYAQQCKNENLINVATLLKENIKKFQLSSAKNLLTYFSKI